MPTDVAETAQSVSKLKQACDAAYALYPNSCSHAVWHVIKQYLPNQAWMSANALVEHMRGQAHWKIVPAGQVGRLAREGVLVVGGKSEATNGHVIVVYPGPDTTAGGYSYTRDGKALRARDLKAHGGQLRAGHVHLVGLVARCQKPGGQNHLGPLGQRRQIRAGHLLATGAIADRAAVRLCHCHGTESRLRSSVAGFVPPR